MGELKSAAKPFDISKWEVWQAYEKVKANKGAVQAILRDHPRDRGPARERRVQDRYQIGIKVFLSEDAKEGPLAFKEKRAPNFKMR